MNSELRVKWFLYILNNNRNRGFNMVALMVVMLILGILAAIPFANVKTPHVGCNEGEQYVSSFTKAQEAYYTENGKFVTENTPEAWASLGVGIKTQTSNYKYSISPIGDGKNKVKILATPISKTLKGYTGIVGLVSSNPRDYHKTLQAIVCQTKNAGDAPIGGEVTTTELKCLNNSKRIE